MAPAIRGNSLYKIIEDANPLTWSDAENRSILLGGHLVTINDAAENLWIQNNFNSYTSKTSGGADFWIGLTDKDSEGLWEWVDGTPFSYSNFRGGSDNGTRNGIGNYPTYDPIYTSAQWWMGANLPLDRTIGEDYALVNAVGGSWNDVPINHRDASVGIAEIPLTSSITFSDTPKEGAGVFTTSINLSAGTGSNLANGAEVFWKISGITSDDLASGSMQGSGTISNGKLEIQHSLKEDPDSGEQFEVSVYSDSSFTQQVGATTSATIQEGKQETAIFTVDPIVFVDEGQRARITIRRTGNTQDSHYIRLGESWRASQLPAKIGEDFVGDFVGKELTMNAGQSEISFEIRTIDDSIYEDLRSVNWSGRGEWFDVIASVSNGIRFNTPTKWQDLPGFKSPDGQARIFINDNDPKPIYTLTASSTSINEGSTLTTTVSTTNVTAGTTLYWALSGTDINSKDFSSGALSGSGTVASNGGFSFSHGIANDLTTEGVETLEIKLFSDSARSTQVAATSVTINDTSLTQTGGTTITNSGSGNQNVNIIEDSYVNYWSNTGTVNNGTMNSNNTTNNYTYNYYNSNNTNISNTNTTNNVNSNNTSNSWNIYSVDNSVSVGDITSQWFNESFNTTKQSVDLTELKLLDITASTWADKILINRVAEASDSGGDLVQGQQLNRDSTTSKVGSVLNGGRSNDVLRGLAAWDLIDGGSGDDLIHGGNGRDIIQGGAGSDELHGDFGWNTYKSEKDGFTDLIAIKSDQFLNNWWYGKAGNSPNGEKADIIEGLDSIDQIKIIGVSTSDLSFRSGVSHKGVTGVGIYARGILEALYTGGDLSAAQIAQMTTGDDSATAVANQMWSYWSSNIVPDLLA